jgi:guanyl-specific ribonuclease Sa
VQLLFWDGTSAKEVMNVPAADIEAAINKFTGAKSNTATNSTNNTLNSTGAAATTATTSTSNSNSTSNASNANSNANTTANTTKLTTINNGNAIVISKVNGYTLNYSKDGYLWITTPANFEGKVYTFSWQKDF